MGVDLLRRHRLKHEIDPVKQAMEKDLYEPYRGILSDRFMRFYIITIAIIMSIGVCWGMLTILRVFPPAPSFHRLTVFELMLTDSGRTTIILTRGAGVYHLRGNFSDIFKSDNTYDLKLLVWDQPQTRACYVLEIWDVTDPDNELHWDFSTHDFGANPYPPYTEPLPR